MPDNANGIERDAPRQGHVTLPTNEARQGVELGAMRYVLGVSLAVSVVSLVAVYFFVFH
jgi:hypothetical protein